MADARRRRRLVVKASLRWRRDGASSHSSKASDGARFAWLAEDRENRGGGWRIWGGLGVRFWEAWLSTSIDGLDGLLVALIVLWVHVKPTEI